jgi:F-type H+-transporting ATPase subunit b
VNLASTRRLFSALALTAMLAAPIALAHAQQTPAGSQQPAASQAQPENTNQPEADENDKYLRSPSVRAMGAKLGMNPEQASTVFTVANFVVLALLIGWYLLKALPRAFRNRTTTLQKNLVDARTATEEANARLSSVEDRLSKLDQQIAAMRAQAEKDTANDEQRIKAGVEDEKQKILAAAEQEITAATSLAQRQIQQYAAELAIEQAARKLVVTAETDRLLVQNFARRLTGDDSKGGQN